MGRILKGLAFDGEIDVALIDSTDIVGQAIGYFNLSPLSAAALGRALTACAFMSSELKNAGERLSVTIRGDGVGGEIVVCGNAELEIRGYIENPNTQLPLKSNGKLDVSGCVGKNGKLSVVRSSGLKEPYTGSCRLVSGELAEDFAAYYLYSEQQPIGMALGVKIAPDYSCIGAGGVVFKPMPDASESNISRAEQLLNDFSAISTMIEKDGLDAIKAKYFGDCQFTEYSPVYKCICSREYIERLLLSFGAEELRKMESEQEKIEVECHFCDKKYTFTKEEIEELLADD